MIGSKPEGVQSYLTLLYPALMLGIFFIVPFGIMVTISFFQRDPGGFYFPVLDTGNYRNLFSALFVRVLIFSLFIGGLCAAVCISIGFPFTYCVTRMRRKAQVVWLVFLLSVLSLSEVIVGFTWSLLLSQTAGLSNLFVWLGLMQAPVSWSPGFVALLLGICYIAFPYTVLILYPPLSRLDPSLPEAAQTLGASPLRTFFTVVVGSLRNAIVATFVMVFVFTLGAYLLPQILGRPQHWTLSVLITDQAIYQSNLPMSAAMAVFFMLVSLALVGLTMFIGKKKVRHEDAKAPRGNQKIDD
jgi:putative spermidine/putrescine transport system permease protein